MELLHSNNEDGTKIWRNDDSIIKIKSIPSDHLHLTVNEGFVGLYGINKLREILPYFALIEGVTLNKNDTNIIYYEYIPGVSIKHYFHTHRYKDCVDVLQQVFLALYIANIEIGYTHNDLNYNNIIIKELDHKRRLKIPYKNTFIKFKTKAIPIIIDYEYSHMVYQGVSYGRSAPEINISRGDFWIVDVFKLLMFLYRHTSEEINITMLREGMDEHKRDLAVLRSNILSSDTLIKSLEEDLELATKALEEWEPVFQKNSDLLSINKEIARYLSFFIGSPMDAQTFKKFHDKNKYYTVRSSSRLSNLKFKDFMDFVSR
jgi:hypothetical protein